MPKAFWKGVISFGLVAIPVKMYVATKNERPSFHLLHKKCLTRPRQVLYCESDNEYFSSRETVRGYEVAKEQFVVLDESDFNKVPVRTTHAIDIRGFIEAKEIDPIYFYSSHYLEPEELGVKPFNLLKKALEETRRVGIAKVSFAKREHLVCMRPLEDLLALHTMHYKGEIVPWQEIAPPQTAVSKPELDMAVSLIKAMATTFKPEEYRDEYQAALKKVIQAKIEGKKILAQVQPKIEVGDLMATLRASVEKAQKEPVAVR